jgi:hypothetical protein
VDNVFIERLWRSLRLHSLLSQRQGGRRDLAPGAAERRAQPWPAIASQTISGPDVGQVGALEWRADLRLLDWPDVVAREKALAQALFCRALAKAVGWRA